MKCPKCGFNSFEFYDTCKKCSSDLSGFKKTYFISSVVLPQEIKERKADEYKIVENDNTRNVESIEKHDDMFSFDLEETTQITSRHSTDTVFAKEEPLFGSHEKSELEQGGDFFSDFLESTSQADESLSGTTFISTIPSEINVNAQTTSPSEFDLDSFSWDDAPTSTNDIENKSAPDDFDSLFGDTADLKKK